MPADARVLPMLRLRRTTLVLAGSLALAACETVPITGRQQLNFIDPETEAQLGEQAFVQVKAQEPVSRDAQANATVARIASRIVRANALGGDWEFVVIEKPMQNAFALPGGNIAVYRGMMQIAQGDAELATVIAHEIGHVIAHHAAERISRSQLIEAGAGAASIVLGGMTGTNAQTLGALLGAGATFGLELPFSREQEYEADRIGLTLMARAGYDPREAIEFWQRMQARAGSDKMPEFFSTHPITENRIERLRELLPEAMKHYQAAPQRTS